MVLSMGGVCTGWCCAYGCLCVVRACEECTAWVGMPETHMVSVSILEAHVLY